MKTLNSFIQYLNKRRTAVAEEDLRENPIEESIGLRIITSAMAIVGILAACNVADTAPSLALFGMFGVICGNVVSYWRRRKNNFWIKWVIALGILIVLRSFCEEIIFRIQASIADAREPLTNMMIALLALHCFDLPRRRDLNLSALVGFVLMASAATLSRDNVFGIYLLVFAVFGVYMCYLDSVSRTNCGGRLAAGTLAQREDLLVRVAYKRRFIVPLIVCVTCAISLVFFLVIPRSNFGFFKNVRVSFGLNIPMQAAREVNNPMLSHFRRQDGSIAVDPMAYYGFAQELDLNYRGELSKQIVLRVGSSSGEYWRAMAFDTFDGHRWTMSDPNKTYTRVSAYGSGISLAQVPSLTLSTRVRTRPLTQVFYYEADQPNLIAAASVPTMIYFPIGNVEIDNYGSIRSPMFMERDTIYTVLSQVPCFVLADVRATKPLCSQIVTRVNRRYANYLQLPENLPPEISKLADQVAGNSGNWFVRAEKIDNFLKRTYKYNLDIPPTPDNKNVVAEFLFNRKMGYCEHFASAFVVMCRTQGIPARLVTGFTPGEHNALTGLWEVRMQDAHAWAEIFMPRWGWVPFDPTPDGAGPGLPGKSTKSSGEFLAEQLRVFVDKLLAIPFVAETLPLVAKMVEPLWQTVGQIVSLLSVSWVYIIYGAFLALATVMAIKLMPYLRYFRNKVSEKKAKKSTHFATEQLLKVCRDLDHLEVNRQPHDTAADLIRRLEQSLAVDFKTQATPLIEDFQDFLDFYNHARFSSDSDENLPQALAGESGADTQKEADKSKRLGAIATRIHDRVETLREQKKKFQD